MTSLIEGADRAVGRLVEGIVTAHHRRRLSRVGWQQAYASEAGMVQPGQWAAGDPPPRAGNAMDVLIDGAEALAAMTTELRRATSHVYIAGWHVTPDFALTRGVDTVILREVLAELAARLDVKVLLWAGAPFPLFRPARGDARKVRDRLVDGNAIRCALDARERPMHCHHEKTIVIDDRVAFVGGIDLTSLAGDRYDTIHHPNRGAVGWHDAAARVSGPIVQDVANHFRLRWHATTGESLPAPAPAPPAGPVEIQMVRTMPDGMYSERPRGDFRILEAYLRALRSASKFIYIENQFLWSPEILDVLRDKLLHPPTPDFRLLLVLPAKPNSGGDDTRGQLSTLAQADADAGRLLACTIYARGDGGAQPVYVHAKVCIVDDRWLTLGSANLNEHSLFNDTEVNLVVCDRELVQTTRERLWAEHLERPRDQVTGDPGRLIDELWKPIAREQLERQRQKQPLTHRLAMLPGDSKRAGLLLGPLQGLLVDG